MNEITKSLKYSFGDHLVRVTGTFDEPRFVAADVCAALGIENSRHAVSRLDDDEKGVVISDTLGGPQELVTVSESGLYTLILTSRKDEAKKFKRWVTHEVLPDIRKTGMFIDNTDRYMSHPVFMQLKRELRESLRADVDQVLQKHLHIHLIGKFPNVKRAVLDPIVTESKDFLSNYFLMTRGSRSV